MGGRFSALHGIWMCKRSVSLLRTMGDMSVTDSGILQWTLNSGDIIALQQFRDNVMVAAKGPTPRTTMYTVCCTMESIWGLWVLCPCRDKDPNLVCHGDCGSDSALHGCLHIRFAVLHPCTCTPQITRCQLAAKVRCTITEPLGYDHTAHHQCAVVGPLQCFAFHPFLGPLFAVGDRLDATGLSLRIPSPRRARLRSLLSSHPRVDWGVHRGRGVAAVTI